jgi:N-acetylglutamate synthase-like GNAT family acetyltransferase
MIQHEFYISNDKNKLNVELIFEFLNSEAYWSKGRPRNIIEKSIKNSLCYGIYDSKNNQVGFARVITDFAVYAYILDLFIINSHRGQGLGKQLIKEILSDPISSMVKNWSLATRDAHELYRQFGFSNVSNPERLMSMSRLT